MIQSNQQTTLSKGYIRMIDIQSMNQHEITQLIDANQAAPSPDILAQARSVAHHTFGRNVYVRGLIEISNYCKNDCLYCGIRKSNPRTQRYRLSKQDILSCCHQGYRLGFRTFVLQGGEDRYYTDACLCDILSSIKADYPDCAITLSLGERTKESYQALYRAGADRYLLRHETADDAHYAKLHPADMTLASRKECLYTLKEIGFQVGAGFMVGSPHQTTAQLAQDILFLKDLQPHMVGIGPFIPHAQTPFAHDPAGTLPMTILMIALVRLMLPHALLPATTALGTISPHGREQGIFAGANVVMPNLSPIDHRNDYSLYDNKICTGDEAAECRDSIEQRIQTIGYSLCMARGDHPAFG